MPPKKRKAAPPPNTAKATNTSTRRSKLAKENDITAEEEAEIKSAWALFRVKDVEGYEDEKDGVLGVGDLKAVLAAQNLAPKTQEELREFTEILDPETEGYITYHHFVELCALRLKTLGSTKGAGTSEEEVEAAFQLFTRGEAGKERRITVNDLKEVARLLKEDVSEDVLRAMVLEANGGKGVGRGVDREAFAGVLKRAGVFQ